MLVIFDGPEASGKTSVIREMFPTAEVVSWGPVESADVYLEPALKAAEGDEYVIWDRGWASEYVYNQLLDRGRDPEKMCRQLEQIENVRKIMIVADAKTLANRRQRRIDAGETGDLPLDPAKELGAFMAYANRYRWAIIDTSWS